MIFASIAEQRNIEDNARLKSAKARRNRERRPAKAQETNAELRLKDIDTGSPDLRPHKGSPWDET
jgi:hypothetical protein